MPQEQQAEEIEKTVLWDKQPLGLFLYAFLFIALTAPGMIVIDIALQIFKIGSIEWTISAEASMAFASIAGLIGITTFFCKRSISTLPFKIRGCVIETLAGYLIGAAIISIVINLLSVTGHFHRLGVSGHFNVWAAITLCFLIAVFEETVFRGYMLPAFERSWGTFAAVIASSLIFGAIHIMNVLHEPLSYQLRIASFIALEAGLPLAGAYLATRRLWLPIGLHWAWNFFLGPIYGAPVSGLNIFGSYNVGVLTGSSWITGGKFGPEGGVYTLIVGTLVGIALLIVAARAKKWKLAPNSPIGIK
jgi:membrane protease YdiL (CAAX protease family)